MKVFTSGLLGPIALVPFLLLSLSAAEIRKAPNNTGMNAILDAGESWIGGVVPTSTDVAVWDYAATGYLTSTVSNASWGGIVIRDVITQDRVPVHLRSPGPLALGGAGIDMSEAAAGLELNSLNANRSFDGFL